MASDILTKLLDKLQKRRVQAQERLRRRRGRHEATREHPTQVSEAFRLVRTGTLTFEQYLQGRVDTAVEPLHGLLHAADMAFVRAILWERLETDPVVARLVTRMRAAIGGPSPAH
jgi:hypothetical protein